MEIVEVFNNKFVSSASEEKFSKIHKIECEEVLDNLGYISLNRNSIDASATDKEINNGVAEFRKELEISKDVFKDLYPHMKDNETNYLNENELDFLHQISSLEGEFHLHQYSLNEIAKNPILSRILNWRLFILSIFNDSISPKLSPAVNKQLNKIGKWCGINETHEIIEVLGDCEKLSTILVKQNSYPNAKYEHIIFFKNTRQKIRKEGIDFKNDVTQFRSRLVFLPEESKNSFHNKAKNLDKVEFIMKDELHQLMTRLVQIRLWLFGTYQGNLDNDLGPLSLKAIDSFISYIHENYGGETGYKMTDLVINLKKNYWALNVQFLFTALLPVITRMEESKRSETVSEEIGKLLIKLNNDSDRKQVIKEIGKQIEGDQMIPQGRNSKTRGGKLFLKSIGRFFKRIGSYIKKGINWIIKSIKNLFKWIKNGVKILLRELKKMFSMIKTAFSFFFSKRVIKTMLGDKQIITDYDFNFDNITSIHNIDAELVIKHINKNDAITQALHEVAEFLGTALHIAIKIAKGPVGWIQLGIQMIKALSDNKFEYNRLSFTFVE
ncbi:hypothetical protein [Carboxylicivirga sp. RSCT41]|uniref:hypothetical protein n=1 Tax=Carboxylicivirga agarovorans TaxID=3417570 RepID=UPI003D3546AD